MSKKQCPPTFLGCWAVDLPRYSLALLDLAHFLHRCRQNQWLEDMCRLLTPTSNRIKLESCFIYHKQSQKTLFSSGFFLLSMKMQMILKLCILEGFLYYMIHHIPCLLALKCSGHPLPLPQNLHGWKLTYCMSPTATPCHACSVPAPGLCMSTADQNKNTPMNYKA